LFAKQLNLKKKITELKIKTKSRRYENNIEDGNFRTGSNKEAGN